jgi:hypothetical protein
MSAAELDDLVRQIDWICDQERWDELVALRDGCRAALERGKQLWPAASLAEYRLALDAPGSFAGAVLVQGAGHMALGPLTEVAAVNHTWGQLRNAIPDGPMVTIGAHERVVRGEDLRDDDRLDAQVLDLPAALQPWEPDYPLAEYEPHEARFPPPALPERTSTALDGPGRPIDDASAVRALIDLCRAWTSESNGRAEAVAVEGDAPAAIAALGPSRVRMTELDVPTALAWMAWVGASGGAHGRRRGMAAGRFGAWWTVAALAGVDDDWPLPPDELGALATELRWFAWDAWEPDTGWRFHLAVEDPAEGLAWAVAATDAA